MLKFFIVCIVLIVVAGGGVLWYWDEQVDVSHGRMQTEVGFILGKGEGATVVAERLEQTGIIASKLPFLYYVMRSNLEDRLQSGEYRLSGSMTIPEIVDRLVEGKVIPPGVRITFPEGFTAKMMAERLTKAGLPGDDFLTIVQQPYAKWGERYTFLQSVTPLTTLEGFLFPDTYIFPREATGELIVNELLKTFEKKAWPLFEQYNNGDNRRMNFYDSVILASIIEEEGKGALDRRMISDIFLKRLEIGQPLQSDATVNYALGTSNMQPTFKDIESDSPYNTYKHPGLPPTPIANPGVESLQAALDPIPNEYYYFLNNLTTGETVFSKTFEEHVQNRQKHGL